MHVCKNQNILDASFICHALVYKDKVARTLLLPGQCGLDFTDWPLFVALIHGDSLKEQNKRVTRWGRPGRCHTPIEYQLGSLTRGWRGESVSVLDVSQKRVWGWWRSRKEGRGKKAREQSTLGCISCSSSIIHRCCLKTVNMPWRLYLKNIDKYLTLISQIISQTGTEVIFNTTSTRSETSDIWKTSGASGRVWVYSHEPRIWRMCDAATVLKQEKVITCCLK